VAVIGDNRKLLVFPVEEVPEMKRGQGVILQRYKTAGLSDLKVFNLLEGLTWGLGSRTRTELDVNPWLGHRGAAGIMPPTGFPRENKF
jgi:topoisomerase-4 subunit A